MPAASRECADAEDKFPVEVVRGVPVVAAPEEIDITNAEAPACRLWCAAAANGHGTLVVDIARDPVLRFIQAAFPDRRAQRAEAEGREVLLVIPSTTVLRVFTLTGIDRVIPNFTSLAEALDANSRRRERPQPPATWRCPCRSGQGAACTASR